MSPKRMLSISFCLPTRTVSLCPYSSSAQTETIQTLFYLSSTHCSSSSRLPRTDNPPFPRSPGLCVSVCSPLTHAAGLANGALVSRNGVCVFFGRAEATDWAFWNTFAKAVFSLVEISVEVVPKHEHCIYICWTCPPYCFNTFFFIFWCICFRHFVRVDVSIEILLAETKSEKSTSLRAILEYTLWINESPVLWMFVSAETRLKSELKFELGGTNCIDWHFGG